MSGFLGLGILGTAVFWVLIPYAVTLSIALDTAYVQKEKKLRNRIAAAIMVLAVGADSLVLLLCHRFLLHRWNPLGTAKEILRMRFSYQEICAFAVLIFLCMVCGGIVGVLIRFFLPRLLKKTYGHRFLTARRKTLLFALFAVIASGSLGMMYYGLQGAARVVINEVASFNKSKGVGENNEVCDYIELYNRGRFALEIEGLFLSDDAEHLLKWEIPAQKISPSDHIMIPMNNVNFSISRSGGETIYLSDDLGRILDQVTLPAVDADISYSRTEDGGVVWDTVTQTPLKSNSEARSKRDIQVEFSHEGGFYSEAFYLSMVTAEGYEIYYTLDGSTPDENGIHYTQPVYVYDKSAEPNLYKSLQRVVLDWKNYTPSTEPVDKGFIIRAVAVGEDGSLGDESTATYFVDLEQYRDKPVVSLVADPDELFGEDGIYVTGPEYDALYLSEGEIIRDLANFVKSGRQTEIAAHMEYYADENSSFRQNVGLRISGSSSREGNIKRFSVYARNQYSGSQVFEKELFAGVSTRRIQLRNGYVNGMSQLLAADRKIAIQRSLPVYIFVNGEYWNKSYILEKYDGHYFQERYGVHADELILCKGYNIHEKDEEHMIMRDAIFDYLQNHDLQKPEDYAGFAELVDIQSYIDFMCANIYMNNMDFSENKNSIWWRSRSVSNGPYSDGKWRLALYDMDFVDYGAVENRVKVNTFTADFPYTEQISEHFLYSELITNPDFCRQFILTFMDMVNTNFRYETVEKVLDTYDPSEDAARFHYFFRERAKYIVPYMAEEFGLAGTLETVALSRNGDGGSIKLNTIVPDLSQGSWGGQYYTDYPVTVTAVPEKGYRFVGWEGDVCSAEPTLEITLPTGGVTINAIFEKE